METIIKLTEENLSSEHICCAISDKKCHEGYQAKKQWLSERIKEGYTFKKLNVRGKVFIEYGPAEKAWVPVDAPGYMLINCFWVSGQYKDKGYGKALYQECEKDAAGMNGIVVVSSNKKQPFMSEKKFFQKQGFTLCDTALPYFELWYKPLKKDAPKPSFLPHAKNAECDIKEGLAIYYTHACPFNEYYVAELEVIASLKGHKITTVHLDTLEKARNHFVPHTLYSIFQNGKFITQHILNENYFEKFIKH